MVWMGTKKSDGELGGLFAWFWGSFFRGWWVIGELLDGVDISSVNIFYTGSLPFSTHDWLPPQLRLRL